MFAKYVSEETIGLAGFNWWEPGLIFNKGNYFYTVYSSYVPELNLNVVVIEGRRLNSKYRRIKFYFGTFEGLPSEERSDKAATDEFDEKVRKIAARKNRVAGQDLELTILKALEEGFIKHRETV